jgi:hypothetical protein
VTAEVSPSVLYWLVTKTQTSVKLQNTTADIYTNLISKYLHWLDMFYGTATTPLTLPDPLGLIRNIFIFH